MEVLIRWRCPCLRSAENCPYCHGNEYLELWVAQELVRHVVGGTDFLIRGRRTTPEQLPSSTPPEVAAPTPKRPPVAGATLFVRGLPPSFTIRDLEEMFAPFGSVLWGRILDRRREYCGWAYIDMASLTQAVSALQVLDGSQIEGQNIVVMLSIHAPYALQADRFLQLNLGKAFCEPCIRAHATRSNVFPKEQSDAIHYLYECQYFMGVCHECRKTAQVFSANLET